LARRRGTGSSFFPFFSYKWQPPSLNSRGLTVPPHSLLPSARRAQKVCLRSKQCNSFFSPAELLLLLLSTKTWALARGHTLFPKRSTVDRPFSAISRRSTPPLFLREDTFFAALLQISAEPFLPPTRRHPCGCPFSYQGRHGHPPPFDSFSFFFPSSL